jgi:hypothetical protein
MKNPSSEKERDFCIIGYPVSKELMEYMGKGCYWQWADVGKYVPVRYICIVIK